MLRSYLPVWVCLLGLAFAPSAQAGPVSSADELIFQPGGVILKLTNYETIGFDADGDGNLDVGDTLRGIYRITTGEQQSGGDILTLDGFELTGIFETEILSIEPNESGLALGNSYSNITMGAYAPFADEFGFADGTMIAFYEDFTPDFSNVFTSPTIADAETWATDGSLYATFGAAPGSVHGVDYHWTASGYTDLEEFATQPLTTVFAASLPLLSQPGTDLPFVADQSQTPVPAFADLGWENILNELALQGNVTNDPTDSPYPLRSEDPARLHAVPEPSSVVAWAGLAIFGGLTYRRRKATATKA